MKLIYTTLIALLIGFTSFATSDKGVGNNNWGTKGAWNLNRVPQDNDSIIIPAGYTVTISDNYPLNNVVIIVNGTLNFDNGKLRLDDASKVIVETTGKIIGDGSSDQISIGNVFKFKGSGSPIIGYSFADNTTGTYPNGFSIISAGTLPVTFQSFYITRQGTNVQLNWTTTNELNNGHYEIERSTNARTWTQIAVVLGGGTTTAVSSYAYTDKNISDAVVYYRVRQVDMNGNATYSAIRFMRNNEVEQVANIYASSKQTITVDFNSDVKNNVTIQVVNMNGQVVAKQHYNQASYRLTLNIMSASSGIYAVQVSDGNGWSEVKKIAM